MFGKMSFHFRPCICGGGGFFLARGARVLVFADSALLDGNAGRNRAALSQLAGRACHVSSVAGACRQGATHCLVDTLASACYRRLFRSLGLGQVQVKQHYPFVAL